MQTMAPNQPSRNVWCYLSKHRIKHSTNRPIRTKERSGSRTSWTKWSRRH